VKLAEKKVIMLAALKQSNQWESPTLLGQLCKQDFTRASSWASQVLKALVKDGLVERNDRGNYRVKP